MSSRSVNWLLISIILLAMLLRVAVFMPLVPQGLTPVFDEVDYYERAAGLTAVLSDIVRSRPVDPDAVDAFFGSDPFQAGWWPPLQMGVISFSTLLPAFSDTVTKARFVTILLSTLTVPVVYLVAKAAFGRRNAYLSALIFAIYPSFIAFSHYLWSETLYILLQFLLIYFAFSAADSPQESRGVGFSVAAGIALGLAGLARSSALPLFVLAPIWLLVARTRRMAPTSIGKQLKYPFVLFLTGFLIVLPWEIVLFQQQGQIIPLSSSGGYNLYVGSSESYIPLDQARTQIMEYAETHSLSWDRAAQEMALNQIRNDPRQFVEVTFAKFLRQWSGETFILRHLYRVIYPPVSPLTAALITVTTQVSFILLLAFSVVGLLTTSNPGLLRPLRLFATNRGLLLSAAVLSTLFALLAIANTRLVLPVVALLVPFASHGVWSFLDAGRRQKLLLGAVAGVAVLLIHASIVRVNIQNPNLGPSSYYQGVVTALRPYLRTVFFRDQIVLMDNSGTPNSYEVELLGDEYEFIGEDKKEIEWVSSPESPTISFQMRSRTTEGQGLIQITNKTTGESQVLNPVTPEAWQNWIETSLPGITFKWVSTVE